LNLRQFQPEHNIVVVVFLRQFQHEHNIVVVVVVVVFRQFQHEHNIAVVAVVVDVVVVVFRQFQDEHQRELAKAGPTCLFRLCWAVGTAPQLEEEGALEQL